jgi:AbrB family looped-hinge helix DNA binding protein
MVLAAACLNYGSDCWLPPQHLNHRRERLDFGPIRKREGHEHDVKSSQHQAATIASPTVKHPRPRQGHQGAAKGSARKADRHNHVMTTVTLTSKGQLTLPRPLRDALGLAPGARLQASIDRQGRLVLVPSKYEPEELFLHRPKVNRCLSLEQMEQTIAAAAGNPVDRGDA